MKLTTVIFSAISLLLAQPVIAEGDADAGRNKARTCAACHGQDGNSPLPTMYPTIAGVSAEQIQQKLADYRRGQGGKGPMAASMISMAKPLTDTDIADLAAYFSQQQKR